MTGPRPLKRITFFIAGFLLAAGFLFGLKLGIAATLPYLSDALSNPLMGSESNHAITFITVSGVDDPSDTITVTFNGFTLGSVGFGDVDLTHGTSTGLENNETLAAGAASGTWGFSASGTIITLTAPTNAAADEIIPSSTVRILVGTNADGGVNRITNPATTGDYNIDVAGSFGDTGSASVTIVDTDQVSVTGEYPMPPDVAPPGGDTQDTTPPVIFNVQSSSTSLTSVRITWQTDESSNSAVDYGHDLTYASGTVSDASYVLMHQIDLTGLISCKMYMFRVRSSDANGNSASSGGYSFTTPCDTTPPVISNVRAENVTDAAALILWSTNEPATSLVQYGLTAAYGKESSVTGFLTSHAVPLAGLLPSTTYHYRVISVDAYGNPAVSGDFTFITLPDSTPPTNVSLTAVPGDGRVDLSWTVPPEPDFAGVRLVRKEGGFPTGPFDGKLIYDGLETFVADTDVTNGITYYYGAYAYDTSGNYASGAFASAMPQGPPEEPPPEVPPPEVPPPEVPPPEVPPETGPTTTIPEIPPPIEPPPETGVTTTPPTPGAVMVVHLFGAGGTLPLAEDSSGRIGMLANSSIRVSAPASMMNGTPDVAVFIIGRFMYNLRYNPETNAYEGTFTAPSAGIIAAKGQAIFSDGRVAETDLTLYVQNRGRVVERLLTGGSLAPIPGASVFLFVEEAGAWVPWNASPYGQTNPVLTDAQGAYAFEVPPGRYYAEVKKDGFKERKTAPVFVDDNVYNETIEIIKIPLSIEQIIEEAVAANARPIEVAVEVMENIGEQVSFRLQQIQQDVVESPAVQRVNKEVVSPAALTVTAVNAASVFSAFNIIAYLQYLFTQPLLLLWRRKRKGFGVVYNSLTKLPVDLAIIRLIHTVSGLTVQTRVTDRHGRYMMKVSPGTYRLEAVKPNYVFPSEYMKGKKIDVDFTDLYHGEEIAMKEEGVLTLNIPMDPKVAEETPRKILVKRALRKMQHAVAFSGVLISIGAFAVTPSMFMAAFIVFQLVIYLVFRKLSVPAKPKSWGKVYDLHTKTPLARAIVRIYDSKFNRLLGSQVTDGKGRYGFLVGKNIYYLTGAAKGYVPKRTDVIDFSKIEKGVIDKHIGLEKEGKGK
jgi:hypothetical protein